MKAAILPVELNTRALEKPDLLQRLAFVGQAKIHMSARSDPSSLLQLGERAEALGFHSLWVGDSLTARPRIDALTTLAAVGARTQRLRLGTAIFLAALRHPVLLAYQLASLDWITGGRIDFGLGYGRPKDPAGEHDPERPVLRSDLRGGHTRHLSERLNVLNDLNFSNQIRTFTCFQEKTMN